MTVRIFARHTQGEFSLDVDLDLRGPVTALSGPSGAGKTTILQIVAGLVTPREGRVVVNGEVWLDRAAKINLPPHRRRIGYVFQEGRLLPHLSVRSNLMFGRWFRRGRASRIDPDEVIALLGIGHLLERRPGTLSGGESQRVAIGRALISDPDLLLMDEPLASLDAARRQEILPYLEKLRERFRLPTLYVSHTQGEIDRLADEIVRLENGLVVSVAATTVAPSS